MNTLKKPANLLLLIFGMLIFFLGCGAAVFSTGDGLEEGYEPVAVNIQVDLEDAGDLNAVYNILDEIENRSGHATLFVTGEFASNHPDVVKAIEGREHQIAVHGWQKGEDITLLSYEEQLDLIEKSFSAVRNAVSRPDDVVDFKSQDYKFNNDTLMALQDFKARSISGSFACDSSYCKCWYARSLGRITFPYPVSTEFWLIPVSTIEVDSANLLLDDSHIFKKTGNSSDYLNYLLQGYNERNETKEPLIIIIHPSITGADYAKLNAFSQFLDNVKDTSGKIADLGAIRHFTEYIGHVEVDGPDYAFAGDTVTVTVTYTSKLYCPTYYFRAYGQYSSEKTSMFSGWEFHDQYSEYVYTGIHTFKMQVKIPRMSESILEAHGPDDELYYVVRVPGRACSGTCWPAYIPINLWIYEKMGEHKIKILSAEVIELNAADNIEIGEGMNDETDIDNPIWESGDEYKYKPVADVSKSTLKIETKLEGINEDEWEPTVKYVWIIYGGPSEELHGGGEFEGWEGTIDKITVPKAVGQYHLGLTYYIYKGSELVDAPQAMTHKLYVTHDVPVIKIWDDDGPEERWLYVATDWGGGAETAKQVAENVANKEYTNPFSWEYKDTWVYWEDMIDSIPGDKATCLSFAEVWTALTKVLGLDTSYLPYFGFGEFFITDTKKALDNNNDANVRKEGELLRERWLFGNHWIGEFAGKYYDPTFGLTGYTDKSGNAEYVETEETVIVDELKYTIYKSIKGPAKKIRVRETSEVTHNGWPIYEYGDFEEPMTESESISLLLETTSETAGFTGNIADSGLDTDGDGLFNYLMANVEVDVTEPDNYSIDARLRFENTTIAAGSLSMGFGINYSNPKSTLFMDAGMHDITLYFSGRSIYEAERNGNYTLDVVLNGDGQIDAGSFNTSYYDHSQFQGLTLDVVNITDYGFDADGDGKFDQLMIEIESDVNRDALYEIRGFLLGGEEQISYASNSSNLVKGSQTLFITFNGPEIRSSRVNAPYVLELFLADEYYSTVVFYNTSSYEYLDFQMPSAELTGIYSDYGTDSDGDALYNYLTVEAEVSASIAGNYTLLGWLGEGGVMRAYEEIQLDTGTHPVTLNFDGMEIYSQEADGPYDLSHIALFDENGTLVDSIQSGAYITSAYSYTEFQAPSASFQDIYQDHGADTNGDGLYDDLIIDVGLEVASAGNYTLAGWLYDKDGNEMAWISNTAYMDAGIQTSSMGFDGRFISIHGVEGPYNLGNLALYDEKGILVDYRLDAYNTTFAYNYTDFQQGVVITGNIKDHNEMPVPNATVMIVGSRFSGSARTDVDGVYNIAGLPNGIYTIYVTPPDPNIMRAYRSYVRVVDGRTYVINFTLSQAGSVAGRVTDADGMPVPDVHIHTVGYEPARHQTDENGTYLIPWLPTYSGVQTRSYAVSIDAHGYDSWYILVNGKYAGYGTTVDIDVTLGQTTFVDFTQQPPQSPDMWIDSDSFNVSIEQGATLSIPLTIGNTGDEVLEFEIRDVLGAIITDPEEGGFMDIKNVYASANSQDVEFIIETYTNILEFNYIWLYLWLDTDQNSSTGALGTDEWWSGYGFNDISAEYALLLNIQWDIGYKRATLFKWDGDSFGGTAILPMESDTHTFSVSVPLANLDDDGNIDYTLIMMGGRDVYVEWNMDGAPNEGHSTIKAIEADWLSEDPASGVVNMADQTMINVLVDATDMEIGEYEAGIVIESNDVDEKMVIIPVHLTVTEQADINQLPVADAGGPYEGNEGSAITLDGSGSHDLDDFIVSWEWDLDGDGVYEIDATDNNGTLSHGWCDDYSGDVCLKVMDSHGEIDRNCTTVKILNLAPIADAGFDQDVEVFDAVSFTGGATDTACDTLDFWWDFGDSVNAGGQNPSHVYDHTGVYTATLTVSDDDGGAGNDISIVNVARRKTWLVYTGDVAGFYGDVIRLSAVLTDKTSSIENKNITFEIGGQITSALTDAVGRASTTMALDIMPVNVTENYSVAAVFYGDEYYDASANSTLFAVKSPMGLKIESISVLENMIGADPYEQHDIDKAISAIADSLSGDLWIDSSHLNSQNGHKVFDEEKKAVKHLINITEGVYAESSMVDEANAVINELIKADELLAKMAIYDAVNTCPASKEIDYLVKKAEEEVSKAYQELTDSRPDLAIDDFKKAWNLAQLAIKLAL